MKDDPSKAMSNRVDIDHSYGVTNLAMGADDPSIYKMRSEGNPRLELGNGATKYSNGKEKANKTK